MPELRRDDSLWILDFGSDENRFSPDWLDAVNGHLDELEAATEAGALVTTATGKFFSNGLDLDWVQAHPNQFFPYVKRVEEFLSRVLTLPVPTVCAINGHAFGGGALIAFSHDYRIMRGDRGFFCLPEADIRIPFSGGMSALVQSKLTPRSAIDAMTTARRYGGAEALSAGIVDAVASEEEVLPTAIELARSLVGKDRGTLGTIKQRMFASVTAALAEPLA